MLKKHKYQPEYNETVEGVLCSYAETYDGLDYLCAQLEDSPVHHISKSVDERGIPTELEESGSSAPYAPDKPCELCPIGSPVQWDGTNFEWCQHMNTCAATIDWDKVYGHE